MKTAATLACAGICLGLILTGCESTNTARITSRVQEKSALFASLTPEQQAHIQLGAIEAGYTPDMVYLALGQPSQRKTEARGDASVLLWTYHNYFPTDEVLSIMVAKLGAGPVPGDNLPYAVTVPRRQGSYSTLSSHKQQFRANKTAMTTGVQPNLSSTSTGPQTSLDLPELVGETLHVLFFKNRVFDIQLGPEASIPSTLPQPAAKPAQAHPPMGEPEAVTPADENAGEEEAAPTPAPAPQANHAPAPDPNSRVVQLDTYEVVGDPPKLAFGLTLELWQTTYTPKVRTIYITKVKPNSDAEAQGIVPGTRIDFIDGRNVEEFDATFKAGSDLNRLFINRKKGSSIQLDVLLPHARQTQRMTLVEKVADNPLFNIFER
jgi:hypothetical protein